MLSKDAPILLVDDSLAAQQSVTHTLNSVGYKNIDCANNGKEALDFLKASIEKQRTYKIIFLDWKMPEMDGLSFLKTCREDMGMRDVAIVMLTAVTDQKSLIMALGSGATSFMTKPVSHEAILRKMDQIGSWLEARDRAH